jgi:hypothetical protein
MKVISNAGPLIALARIGLEHLLPALFRAIVIPLAVRTEVVAEGIRHAGATIFQAATWLDVVPVEDRTAVAVLGERLGQGESEAIVLAIEQKADVLLIDEARGRRAAEGHGVSVLGTLGVLLAAKRHALIPSVCDPIERLSQTGFRMSATLRERVLDLANERSRA